MKFNIKTILRALFVPSCMNLQAMNNQPNSTPRAPRNHTPQQQQQQPLAAALNPQNIALLLQLAALVNQQNQQQQIDALD